MSARVDYDFTVKLTIVRLVSVTCTTSDSAAAVTEALKDLRLTDDYSHAIGAEVVGVVPAVRFDA